MPGATPVYGLPYPITSDRLDDGITTIPHNLALAIESTLQSWGGIAAPGAWTALTLANGTPVGAPYQTPRYRKAGNLVYLQGMVQVGAGGLLSGSLIATLPIGFRPTASVPFATFKNGGALQRIDVASNGQITLNEGGIGANGFFSLNLPPLAID